MLKIHPNLTEILQNILKFEKNLKKYKIQKIQNKFKINSK